MSKDLLKVAVKGAGIAMFGLVFGKAIGFFYRLALARLLSVEQYGLLFLAFAITSAIVALCIQGFPQGIMRYVSFYGGKKDTKRVKGIVVYGISLVGLLGLLTGVLLFLLSDWVAGAIFHSPGLAILLKVLSLSIPLQGLFFALSSAMEGFKQLKYWAYAEIMGRQSTNFVLAIILAILGYGAFGASLAYFAAFFLADAILLVALAKRVFDFRSNLKPIFPFREFFSFSLPLFLSTSILAFSGNIDLMMLGFFKTAASVGIFAVAITLAELLNLFRFSFNKIFPAIASSIIASGQSDELGPLFKSVTKWVFAGTLPLFLVMLLFPDTLISVFFGSAYMAGALSLSILAFGYMVRAAVGSVGYLLIVSGRTKLTLINAFLIVSLNVILDYILIPIYGIPGAAMATSGATIFGSTLMLAEVKHFLGIHPYKPSYVRVLLSGIAAIAVIYGLLKFVFPSAATWALLVGGVVFLFLYLLFLLIFRSFEEGDVAVFRALEGRLGVKDHISRHLSNYCSP